MNCSVNTVHFNYKQFSVTTYENSTDIYHKTSLKLLKMNFDSTLKTVYEILTLNALK